MAKDFSWKSLFINDNDKDGESKQNTNTSAELPDEARFPTSVASPNIGSTGTASNVNITGNPFINEILDVYQKGFDSLNNEGFDFYELYKSVHAVGINNPQSYQMAFAMGKSLRPEISKEFLLDKSQYYISEIEKVFQNYDVIGNSKQKELSNSIVQKKENLSKQIADLQAQITKLQNDLQIKNMELERIDIDNKQMFLEIQQKIEANNLAKQKILESINTVVAGIKQYL
ncbi:hypothetical protein [Chryseobacterium shigense]|uniref:Outer membrane murein-binding lipoprotein Lpp n=1 Tax=Chryseobacterium shigense TaxID=297244 RepID=A0A841NEL2_9FLAO|nr:hypothetical protein [Chryseobacterium shigense]MBB6369325.1 outer membrane murein-binding lipoprotein Lpp [Chryseobacterium shigense]